jgi:opacity protein-like surface antigen
VKGTNTSTPILVVLMVSLVCLLGAPRDARGGDTTKGYLQGAGIGAVMVAACTGFAALTAESETDQDGYARRGWLVGVGGSYAMETFEDDAESDLRSPNVLGPTVSLSADDSFGVNGRAGYRCHRLFSVEVQGEWIDGFDADVSGIPVSGFPVPPPPPPPSGTIDAEPWVVTANTKGYLLTGRYQPFLLLGAGVMTADFDAQDTGLSNSTETNFAMRFGGGIDLYATKHVVVSAEIDYVLPFGNLAPLDYLSIGMGIQYRF